MNEVLIHWLFGVSTCICTAKQNAHPGMCTYVAIERVRLGRRTSYALMGAGFHSGNGITMAIAIRLYITFVIPRMLSGLESLVLTPKEVDILEGFHRRTLRQLQNLPVSTAKEAIYLLTGILPIQGTLDQRILNLFGAICRKKGEHIWNIALNQLINKDSSSGSWFINVNKLLEKYDLPQAADLLINPPTKEKWKTLVKLNTHSTYKAQLLQDTTTKSSLKHLNFPSKGKLSAHRLWVCSAKNLDLNRKAYIKCKLMTHVYGLQKRIYGTKRNVTCRLCSLEEEDEEHFISVCPLNEFKMERLKLLEILQEKDLLNKYTMCGPITNPANFTQLVLDCTAFIEDSWSEESIMCIETTMINFVYKMHEIRSKKMTELLQK